MPYAIKLLRGKKAPGKPVDYEFGGPIGAYGTLLGLPAVILFLYSACGKDFVLRRFDLASLSAIPWPEVSQLCSWKALALCGGWFSFQVLLERTLPGEVVEGVDLAPAGGKGKLKYNINGHQAFWVSLTGLGILGYLGATRPGWKGLAVLYDDFPALAGSSALLSFGLSAYLYWASFEDGALLAKGGDSGNPIYDFFMGRELNPRLFGGTFDLKEFCELRPGLIGWLALNLGMAAKQYERTGTLSLPMLLVNLMQGLYVWDALYQERAILSTMDITTDGFGHMLAFGDMAWVPFTYGLQARYLVDHDPGMPTWTLGLSAGLGLLGYWVFRGSNSEKDAFRRDPKGKDVQHLKVLEVQNLQTNKPSKLLVSGWWGLARKINYTGDWLMAWAWSMTTGCPYLTSGTALTYFYPIYFAVLLIHRAGRDDHFCSIKYGEGWTEYKKKVPCVFIPYVI